MTLKRTLLWIALAIAGLVIAVAGSYAASQLAKPKVGLASEPLSGVARLAPAQHAKPRPEKPERTVTVTTPSTTPQIPQSTQIQTPPPQLPQTTEPQGTPPSTVQPPRTTQTQTTAKPSRHHDDGERGDDGAGNDD